MLSWPHYDNALRANYIMLHDIDYVVSPEIYQADHLQKCTMWKDVSQMGSTKLLRQKEGKIQFKKKRRHLPHLTYQNISSVCTRNVRDDWYCIKTEEDEFVRWWCGSSDSTTVHQRIDRWLLFTQPWMLPKSKKRRYEKAVLVGTVVVETDPDLLVEAGTHEVLNAKNQEKEAHIIMNVVR